MSEKKFKRDIYYFDDYYLKFYAQQIIDVKKKLNWTLELIATI